MLKTLKQCWTLAPDSLKRPWWLLVALSLANALLEMVAATAMVVLLAQLAGSPIPKIPVLRHFVTSSSLHDPSEVVWLCGALAIVFIVKYSLASLIAVLQIRLPLAAGNDLAGRLFRLYLAAPYEFHAQRNSAATIRNLVASVDALFRIVAPSALAIMSDAVSVAAILALLFVSAPLETAAIGVLAFAILFGFYSLFHKRLLFWGKRVQDLTREGLMHARQSLDGIKEIRVFGREQFFWDRYMEVRTALSKTLMRQAELQQLPKVLLEAFFIGLVLLAVVLFSYRENRAEILPLLGLFAYAGLRILPSVGRMLVSVQMIRSGTAASEDVFRDYTELEGVIGQYQALARPPQEGPGMGVQIDGVTFRYAGAGEPTLRDITVAVKHGHATAFVGMSGAGKSTLVNVLLGLLTPNSGTVCFRGINVHEHRRYWQSHIGYVPQSIFLLDDTLRRNVAFGLPDDEIDDRRVLESLEQAQLGEVVRTLPNGLDTRLGEHGARLSGGERQRVAIARALYSDPDVVVFDEATSAVDGITERYVVASIEKMRGKRTVIVVTHHLGFARSCDSLVLLSKGRVVGSGSFDSVAREHPAFLKQVERGDAVDARPAPAS